MSRFGLQRTMVTLYPNSTAAGLNGIAYSLMPKSFPLSFAFFVRLTHNKKRRNRKAKP